MRPRRASACLFIAALLGVSLPSAARAAGDAATDAAAAERLDAKGEAAARFARGRTLVQQGDWDAALAEFLRSRQLFPTWSATASAARCLEQLHRYDEALEMLTSLLREFSSALPNDVKEAAQRTMADLQGRVGAIAIEGAEPGAAVAIDGQSRGELPSIAPLRVTAGTHTVRVYKEGFEPFETRVAVAGLQIARVPARLQALAAAGRLRVDEQGGRALEVVVDGSIVGKTPWEGRLPPSEHVIFLRGEGTLGTPPITASVRRDQTTPLTLAAEELSAAVRIEPEPANARVAIDAVSVGHGIWRGNLRPGAHRIEVAAEGFLPARRVVALARGAEQAVVVALDRDPSSPFARKPTRFTLELSGGGLFGPTLGGSLVSCTAPCARAPALGGMGALRVGVQLASGLGLGVAGGYLAVRQGPQPAQLTVTPVDLRSPRELSPDTLDVSDTLFLRGALAGAYASLSLGARFPVLFRLTAGALLGSVNETWAGKFTFPGTSKPIDEAIGEEHRTTFVYVAPEVRAGVRLGSHVELGVGVEVSFLIDPSPPTWDTNNHLINDGPKGAGALAGALISPVVILFAPTLGARFTF